MSKTYKNQFPEEMYVTRGHLNNRFNPVYGKRRVTEKAGAAGSTTRSWLDISVNEDTVCRSPRTDASCVARQNGKF